VSFSRPRDANRESKNFSQKIGLIDMTDAGIDITKTVECEIIVDRDINKYRNILSLSS
jgi:hypothetical protein